MTTLVLSIVIFLITVTVLIKDLIFRSTHFFT